MSCPLPIDDIHNLRKQATITCDHDFDKVMHCTDQPCLFNTEQDPCEQNNTAREFPIALRHIERNIIDPYRKGAILVPLMEDPASNPDNFNGDWSIWLKQKIFWYDNKVENLSTDHILNDHAVTGLW